MAQAYTAGWGSYVNYGYETTYGTTASSKTRVFGAGMKISHSRKNNMERIYGVGTRNATANVAKKYEGSASLDFVYTNSTWLRALFGAVTDGGAGPSYTHTYTEANTLPSFTIASGTELGTNDEVTELLGCYVKTATINARQGDVVTVKLECPYKNETLATSGISSQSTETYVPYTFAQGLVEWTAGGGTVGTVESFELSIDNDLDAVYGVGSRFKVAEPAKKRAYNIRMTVFFRDTTEFLTKFFGASGNPLAGNPAAQATIALTFDTGGTGASSDKVVFTLTNVYFDEESLPKDVNEVLKEDITGWTLSGTAVWTNGTAADNATP